MSRRRLLSHSFSSISFQSLQDDLVFFFSQSLAASTRATYGSGANSYHSFCRSFGFQPFPVTEFKLCLFAVASSRRGVSHATIRVYLFGIQHSSLMHGYPIRFSSLKYLFYVLRGIRRSQGDRFRRTPREPITIRHLWSISAFLEASSFSDWDKAMWRCISLVAFFGLLRVSEFTCPSVFDPTVHLSPRDISFNREYSIMYLFIKASKTDPFRAGITLRLAAIRSHQLCPVRAMRDYLNFRPPVTGPLFVFRDGTPLTRAFLVAFLRIALPGIRNINSHSFRIGGASSALSAGASDALIRIMGRWSSDCYQRYIRINDSVVHSFHETLSTVDTTHTWGSD